MSTLEIRKESKLVLSGVKVNAEIEQEVKRAAINCPKLLELLLGGLEGRKCEDRIYKPVTTVVK
jgi:hypothetical protein